MQQSHLSQVGHAHCSRCFDGIALPVQHTISLSSGVHHFCSLQCMFRWVAKLHLKASGG